MDPLVVIEQRVAARVDSILRSHPDWLCGRGCDHCCRHLAAPPKLTAPEWNLLVPALHDLPSSVHQRILELDPTPPVTCPLLDTDDGSCRVYHQRPIGCRTYGFYVDRHQGLYCDAILDRVQSGLLESVVWGNAQAVEHDLDQFGPARDLSDWYREKFLCPPH